MFQISGWGMIIIAAQRNERRNHDSGKSCMHPGFENTEPDKQANQRVRHRAHNPNTIQHRQYGNAQPLRKVSEC